MLTVLTQVTMDSVGLMGFGLRLKHPKSLDILAAIITCGSGVALIIVYLAVSSVYDSLIQMLINHFC